MGLFDWFNKKKDKVDIQEVGDIEEDDDDLDEWMEEMGWVNLTCVLRRCMLLSILPFETRFFSTIPS